MVYLFRLAFKYRWGYFFLILASFLIYYAVKLDGAWLLLSLPAVICLGIALAGFDSDSLATFRV